MFSSFSGTAAAASAASSSAGLEKTSLAAGDVRVLDARSGAGLATADDLWLVAFCTPWCAFCQQLSPVWEDLARELRHEASVAWWDVDQPGGPPTAIGGVAVTPTIRAVAPFPGGGRMGMPVAISVSDYEGARELTNLSAFARSLIPDLVERVVDGDASWASFEAKRTGTGLPAALVFTPKAADAPTPPMLRKLSAIFFGELLIAEVRVHAAATGTHELAARFGVASFPAVVALPGATAGAGAAPARLEQRPTFARLRAFMANATLKDEAPTLKDEI